MEGERGFSSELRTWYHAHKRDLPWRNTADPYRIWLSEIILQQTRVAQGMPYYERFVAHYPTVTDLAKASEEQVLRDWQGLGYYSRARNLHATAQIIAFDLKGEFPDNYAEILKLKGVGPYTAAAIASFAFNEKVAPVDGNVIRVLSRYYGIEEDVAQGKTIRRIEKIANELLPDTDHAIHNQAMMEFGALQCVPSSPECGVCPLVNGCKALEMNKVKELPYKVRKLKKRNRYFHYIVLKYKEGVYLSKRGPKDIWTNLYEFMLLERENQVDTDALLPELDRILGNENFRFLKRQTYKKHVLSHQNIYSDFIEIELFKELDLSSLGLKYCDVKEVHSLPKPILINNYLDTNFFS